jgi:hypothetical protein
MTRYITVTIEHNDESIETDVSFDYQPAEPMSRDREYPGCPEQADIYSVKDINGKELVNEIDEQAVEHILLTIYSK